MSITGRRSSCLGTQGYPRVFLARIAAFSDRARPTGPGSSRSSGGRVRSPLTDQGWPVLTQPWPWIRSGADRSQTAASAQQASTAVVHRLPLTKGCGGAWLKSGV
jgi:hypothetical protein